MDRDLSRAFAAALLAFAFAAVPAAPAQGEVTLYRCTDARGTVSVQDTPCAAGLRQDVRTMQRPQDPPPGSRAPPPAEAAPAPPPARTSQSVQTIVLRTPQPMYECVTADGDRYTSDNGDGNPRFVPLWTLGVPYGYGYGHGPVAPRVRDRPVASPPRGGLSTAPVNNISIPSTRNVPQPPPPPRRPPPRHDRGPGYGHGGGGTWIRDTCTALPAAEVCARLRDRRETIRRQTFNAQESERRTLRTEERTLNARLAEDCGL
ncbi:hypothetical protein CO641_14580 [Lysobacteraceae bacterium NML91-0213]|nr:hypothetical protein CO641_14580 [Xanthomonadaceae bacterium NML91-0213]